MKFNKITKLLSIGALTLSALAPATSFAKWTFSDQVNLANKTLSGKVNELNQQIQSQMGGSKSSGSSGSSSSSGSSGSSAGGGVGFYMYIPYRQNDVFVFCKEGPNTNGQDYYWVPTDGVGGFTITNYYAYIYNSESWITTAYYVTICPIGAGPGTWQGTGQPGDYKGSRDYVSPPDTKTGPAQKGQKLESFTH
jgi:hypothetical protein